MLIDNHRDKESFWQLLLFIGERKNATTKSKVRSRKRDIALISDLFFRPMTMTLVFDELERTIHRWTNACFAIAVSTLSSRHSPLAFQNSVLGSLPSIPSFRHRCASRAVRSGAESDLYLSLSLRSIIDTQMVAHSSPRGHLPSDVHFDLVHRRSLIRMRRRCISFKSVFHSHRFRLFHVPHSTTGIKVIEDHWVIVLHHLFLQRDDGRFEDRSRFSWSTDLLNEHEENFVVHSMRAKVLRPSIRTDESSIGSRTKETPLVDLSFDSNQFLQWNVDDFWS